MNDNAYVEAIAGRWVYREPHDAFALSRKRFAREGSDAAFSELKGIFGKGVAAWQRRRAINQIVTALSRLDDARLTDIGIHRFQIPSVAQFVVDNPGVDPRPHLS